MPTLRLGAAEVRALGAGARALGVELDQTARQRLEQYARLLSEWAPRVNLVSCRSPAELVERHLLDSLAVVPLLEGARQIVDLGSGAGLPGVPIAICSPARAVLLVEARRRRASFLRAVRRTLGLAEMTVVESRAERVPPERVGVADAAISRATFATAEELCAVAARWLGPAGVLLWMRAGNAQEAPRRRLETLSWRRRVEYLVAGRSALVDVFQASDRR